MLAQIWQLAVKTKPIDQAFNQVNAQNKLELHQYQVEIKQDDKPTGDREPLLLRGPLRKPL